MANETTASEIIHKVSATLSDQCEGREFTTWAEQELLGYLNEGLCQIFALRPDVFSSVKDITLQAGDIQDFSGEYSAILSINGVQPTDVNEETQNQSTLLTHFRKKSCLNTNVSGAYTLRGFTVDPVVRSLITVNPAVPNGETVTVKAVVSQRPCKLDLADTLSAPCEYESALCDWMLMRAYGVESETDPQSLELMRSYRQGFYDTFQVNYRQYQRFNSGYYGGREGDGDPQFRSR